MHVVLERDQAFKHRIVCLRDTQKIAVEYLLSTQPRLAVYYYKLFHLVKEHLMQKSES